MYISMTNKNYFNSLLDKPFTLSGFSVTISLPLIEPHTFLVRVYKGQFCVLIGSIDLTRRSILLSLDYNLPFDCKFSPYELREWSPAVFLPYTNYLDFMKFFELSLDIFKSKNPKLS